MLNLDNLGRRMGAPTQIADCETILYVIFSDAKVSKPGLTFDCIHEVCSSLGQMKIHPHVVKAFLGNKSPFVQCCSAPISRKVIAEYIVLS